ncbi:putative plant organelle RNA recognition domain-containing protein [Lupinus albus]|uniref:Putative plant organelle RNA recognition domain-containing protein n=1 Tax=Lupinus albus TaxID=3870 RepID=A0A6A4R4T6_LUPAL|nr:putative plant organelle RNA recognition domain-containing protein [Lupinus albus]
MRFALLFSRHKTTATATTQPHNLNHLRTLFDATSFKLVRDRGLDHAVEREKNLQSLVSLKNLIKVEPSKSLPISIIAENRESLKLPFRPIEFVRKYPSVFEEVLPVSGTFQPHVRLTKDILNIDGDEKLMHESDSYRKQLADRLLKLLMISRNRKIPLGIIEHLKWDLGLPQDYEKSVIPEFPDCFRVVRDKMCGFRGRDDRVLELVCWSDELAVSVIEKNSKGGELVFPVKFSTGFEMDKKYEKWLSEWKRLPYVSPYEDGSYLSASSDETDRWIVGVLHEILHILVPKKTEKDNLLVLGDWFGLRSRFKKALLQHPGIFYVSSKIGTYTVVLRDGYKRGSLVEQHPLMNLRSQYVHLMNTVKEDVKGSKVVQGKRATKESSDEDKENIEGGGEEDDENAVEENEGDMHESSDAEAGAEDASESDFDDNEEKSRRRTRRTSVNTGGREVRRLNLKTKKPSRDSRKEKSGAKFTQRAKEKYPGEISKKIRMLGGHNDVESSPPRSRSPSNWGKLLNSK